MLGAILRLRELTGDPEEGQAISDAHGKQRGSQLSLYQSRKPFKTEGKGALDHSPQEVGSGLVDVPVGTTEG